MLIERKSLKRALSLVRLTTANAPPLCNHVLLEGHKGRLRLSTTDLDSWTQTEIDANFQTPDALRLCVPCAPLAAAVNRLQGANPVRLDWAEHTFTAAGESWPTLDADTFPRRPVADILRGTLPLVEPIRRVMHAVSKDATRYALGGVHLGPEWVSATDGHRLARARIGAHTAPEVILPRPWCAALLRAKPDAVTLLGSDDSSAIRAAHGRLALDTRGLGAPFPELKWILEHIGGTVVELDRDAWLQAAETTVPDVPERSRAVRVSMDRLGVRLGTGAPTPATCENWSARPPLTWGANVDYLIDALRALPSGPVSLRVKTPRDPFEIATPHDSVSVVIMPMRL